MKSNDHDLRHSTGKNSEMSLLVRTYANPGISYPLAGRHFDQRHIGDSVQDILRFEAGDPAVVPTLEWETLETFVTFGGAVYQQTVREVAPDSRRSTERVADTPEEERLRESVWEHRYLVARVRDWQLPFALLNRVRQCSRKHVQPLKKRKKSCF